MWGGAGQWSRCTLLDWLTFPAPSLTPEGVPLTEEDQVKLPAHTIIVCSAGRHYSFALRWRVTVRYEY